MLLIIIKLRGFERSMDLDNWVDNTHDAHQHHETPRKEVDDEYQGILKVKGADERLNTDYKKK